MYLRVPHNLRAQEVRQRLAINVLQLRVPLFLEQLSDLRFAPQRKLGVQNPARVPEIFLGCIFLSLEMGVVNFGI